MQGKSIGVILPVYKNDKVEYLSKSVESVLYQTYQDIHLFIGIDGLIGDFLHYFCFSEYANRLIEQTEHPERMALAVLQLQCAHINDI